MCLEGQAVTVLTMVCRVDIEAIGVLQTARKGCWCKQDGTQRAPARNNLSPVITSYSIPIRSQDLYPLYPWEASRFMLAYVSAFIG